ncbi:MAG TPA: hypothetical protein P5229_02380 [Candidatus Gracilibacteria bacterium]|nr:hypothetical protein [Candidatus Gracilibacteria bacterium]
MNMDQESLRQIAAVVGEVFDRKFDEAFDRKFDISFNIKFKEAFDIQLMPLFKEIHQFLFDIIENIAVIKEEIKLIKERLNRIEETLEKHARRLSKIEKYLPIFNDDYLYLDGRVKKLEEITGLRKAEAVS